MATYADMLASSYAAAADLSDVGGESAIVAGIPCFTVRELPYPWATQARVVAAGSPPPPAAVRAVVGWLAARAEQYTIAVRAEHLPDWPGYSPFVRLGAYRLASVPPPYPPPDGVVIEPARDPAEFLVAHGAELAPLVTDRHFVAPGHHHLVARDGDDVIGCAKVRILDGTGYLSAVAVLPPYRRRGVGVALSAAATRLAARHAGLVWLHAVDEVRSLYERIGFVCVDEHVELVPAHAKSAK